MLDFEQYKSVWFERRQSIFGVKSSCSDLPLFSKEFYIKPLVGGCLFDKEDFESLQKCMDLFGDNYFVIEEDNGLTKGSDFSIHRSPRLRFIYPSDIKFEDLFLLDPDLGHTEVIGYELNSPVRNYFVYGDSMKWGKYVGNDLNNGMGLEVLGYD
ncbi:MAG: hypothetical protein ACJAU0_002323 [Flavobacteriales bacterium]|jgi:hypothetical protein